MILFEGTPEEIKALLAERAEQTPDPPPLPKLEPEEVPGPPISRKARLLNAVMASLAATDTERMCRYAELILDCDACPVRGQCPAKENRCRCRDFLATWVSAPEAPE